MIDKVFGSQLGKVLGTLLVVGMAGSTVSYGTFATFTAQATSSGNTFSTGSLTLTTLPADLSARFSTSNLKPGDSVPRQIQITNPAGNINATLSLQVTSTTTATLLSTDTTNGMRFSIDECSVAWTGADGTALTCSGGTLTSNVVADRAIITPAGTALTPAALNSGTTRYFRVTPRLPDTAGDTFKALSETFTFTFTATQLAGEVR